MSTINFSEKCSLLVCSCDKYSDAWVPYFELLKKFWPEHPSKIYLNTETKSFECPDLDITILNCEGEKTWSERLYDSLSRIDTKYVLFTLEDFFLLDYVDQTKLDECIELMEEDSSIALSRIYLSNEKLLKKQWKNTSMYICEKHIKWRMDAQAAIWNREELMNFLDMSESPWAFETQGTIRAKTWDKIILWNYNEGKGNENNFYPYEVSWDKGYGIAWGKWLWNNKEFFEKNGITGVNFDNLGMLSQKEATRYNKYCTYMNTNVSITQKLYCVFYKITLILKSLKEKTSG